MKKRTEKKEVFLKHENKSEKKEEGQNQETDGKAKSSLAQNQIQQEYKWNPANQKYELTRSYVPMPPGTMINASALSSINCLR